MRLDSMEKIQRYRGPLLISHGDADEMIPFRQGRALFEAAPGPKRFIAIPGGKHNDPQTEEYRAALDEFLTSLPPPGATAAARPRFADIDVTVQLPSTGETKRTGN